MIRRLWSNLIKWGWEYEERSVQSTLHVNEFYGNNIDIPTSFKMDISVARGGIVVVVRRYDANTIGGCGDIVHVLPNCRDIAHDIGAIAAMEMLKS